MTRTGIKCSLSISLPAWDHGDLLTFVGKALQDAERFGYAMEDFARLEWMKSQKRPIGIC